MPLISRKLCIYVLPNNSCMVKEHLTVKNNGCRYYEQSLVWGCAPEFSGACKPMQLLCGHCP